MQKIYNFLKKTKQFFRRHIKKIYYDVPPCPVCQCPATGRFVKQRRDTVADWQIVEALRHGELIRPVEEMTRKNCFCINCDYEWIGIIELKLLSLEQIEEEKNKRLTREILNEKAVEARALKRSDHSVLKPMKGFMGKL